MHFLYPAPLIKPFGSVNSLANGTPTTAVRAANFIGDIGVNTHLAADNNYSDQGTVLADLQYLGLSNDRDAALNPADGGQGSYGILAQAGIKFDLLIEPTPGLSVTLPAIDAFVAANPGAVLSLEGPNEVDETPTSYNGLTGAAAAVSFQSALYAAAQADPNLSSLPVLNFTDVSSIVAGQSTDANVHIYPDDGQQPYQDLAKELSELQGSLPNEPVVITEAGYSNANYSPGPSGPGGVDETTQAKLTLNLIMDALKLGYSQVYLYQLLDGAADPSGTNVLDHNGLFDNNNVAKPVAVDLHNFTSILADTGTNASSFTPGSLNYSLTNLPTTGNSFLLQKSTGVFDLVVWNEPQIWNATTSSEVTAAPTTVTLNLGGVYGTVDVYDPTVGTTTTLEEHNVSQIQFSLTDHPLIIEVSTAATAAPIVNNPYSDPYPYIVFDAGGGGYYVVSDPNEVINAPVNSAIQDVQASCSFTLPANLTVLTLTGTANLTGTGNNLNDDITANSGNDTLIAGTGNDHLFGGSGADTLIGGSGTTEFEPGSGVATMIGGSGVNFFNVNNTADVVQAQAGAAQNEVLTTVSYTAPANVTQLVLEGTASITGTANAGGTIITANNAGDTLIGGAGFDHLIGGTGNDTFIVGSGGANLTGGGGSDTFVFGAIADTGTVSHPDIITDFVSGQDTIDLSAIAHAALGAGQSFTFLGTSPFTHVAGQIDVTTTANGLLIQGDTTGAGVADFTLLLTHTTSITAHDLILG